jgi:hypothetical protein
MMVIYNFSPAAEVYVMILLTYENHFRSFRDDSLRQAIPFTMADVYA